MSTDSEGRDRMQIDFGWSADGAGWADASTARGRAGHVRMGPRALLQLLQTRLGLTRPPVEGAVRIAQYLRLIERHLATPSGARSFWPARSFAVDPWSTASQLLRWRDATVEAGWRMGAQPAERHEGLPPRLEALRAVESLVVVGMPGTQGTDGRAATLSPSTADDLAELIALLEEQNREGSTWPLGVDALTLQEDSARLPGLWPRLFELLGAAGVAITDASPDPAAASEPGSAPELVVVQCLDEWSAADVAARFLAAGQGENGERSQNESLTVLASSDTDVLDRALHRRGLPAVGAVAASTDRAHHQVLSLFLEVATAPVDVHQLAALIDLRVLPATEPDGDPIGLVPAPARRRLLDALTQEPGVGGPAWRRALAQLQQRVDEAPADRRTGALKALEAAREIDRLVTDPLPAGDLRPAAISTRLVWLEGRLRAVARGEGDLLASLSQVAVLQDVLGMLDPHTAISRRTLQQIIDTCGGSGPSPRSRPEVSDWDVTTRPAHVRAGSGTVLWWGPAGDETPRPVLWDRGESEALRAGGAHLIDPEQLAALHVEASLQGLRSASRVIAVLPGRILEQAPDPSGLLAHLESARGRDEEDRIGPESLLTGSTWSLAGRSLPVRLPPPQSIDPPRELQRTIGTTAAHLLPTRLSFSQAETLIACPQQWVLKHALGIRPASVADLPTGNRMIGTLVHAVVEALVHQRYDESVGGMTLTVPSTEEIGAAFDQLVPQLASELDLPGRAAERADIRERTQRSLTELFTRTTRAGLRIIGTESRFEHPLTLELASGNRTVPFAGSRDVDARDPAGRPVVLDLKWSRSRTRYGDLYDTGEAIQLASYAWSLAQAEQLAAPAEVGYFLLHSGEFVAAVPELDPRRRAPMDTREAWRRMLAAMTTALDEIAAGTVTAGCRSVLDAAGLGIDAGWAERKKAMTTARETARAAGGLAVENYCASGDHAQLCGLAGDWR